MSEQKKVANNFLKSILNKEITVYLVSGIRLKGTLLEFDEDHILIDGKAENIEGKPQLVFKNAISTILPNNL